jgi:hypothetical protein
MQTHKIMTVLLLAAVMCGVASGISAQGTESGLTAQQESMIASAHTAAVIFTSDGAGPGAEAVALAVSLPIL